MKEKIIMDEDTIIKSKLKYLTFAKAVVFLADELEKNGFVYVRDLADFLKVSDSRANQILREFQRLGLVYKVSQSSLVVEWHGVKNGDQLVLKKYLPQAIETLKRAGVWKE